MKQLITFSMMIFISLSVYANDIYVNQSGADTDTAAYHRTGSSITLMEIGA